jgi:hypothetical protein
MPATTKPPSASSLALPGKWDSRSSIDSEVRQLA